MSLVNRTRSKRETFVARAELIRQLRDPRERRWQVYRCIREIFLPDPRAAMLELDQAVAAIESGASPDDPSKPPCSEAEFFDWVYSEPTGAEYWRLWLRNGESDEDVANLLATHHFAQEAKPLYPEFTKAPLPLTREVATLHVAPLIRSRETGFRTRQAECFAALAKYSSGGYRDRVEAIADDEEWKHLIPCSLRYFLTHSGANRTALQDAAAAEAERSQRNVPRADLAEYLKKTATKQHTKPQLRELAQNHFGARFITDSLFEAAYRGLPAAQRRSPGETRQKLAAADRAANPDNVAG